MNNVLPFPVENSATAIPEKWRRFAEEYLKDFRPARAARDAGLQLSTEQAKELLANSRIQALISEQRRKLTESVNVSVSSVMHNLACIAQTNLPDVMEAIRIRVGREDNGHFAFVVEGLTEEQKAAIKTIKKTRDGWQIELFDKVAATVHIGKYFGIWTDGITIQTNKPVDAINEQMTPEQAALLYQETLRDRST